MVGRVEVEIDGNLQPLQDAYRRALGISRDFARRNAQIISGQGNAAEIIRNFQNTQNRITDITRTQERARTQIAAQAANQRIQQNQRVTASFQGQATALGGSFSGLAAQFQDVGVSIAGGLNPGLVALQQGTQIAGQLELAFSRGASATQVLGQAFRSLFSPIAFVSIAATALVGIGLQRLLQAWGSGAEDAEDDFERLGQSIERLRDLGRELEEIDLVDILNVDQVNRRIEGEIARLEDLARNASRRIVQEFEDFGTFFSPTALEELRDAFDDVLLTDIGLEGRRRFGSLVVDIRNITQEFDNGNISLQEFEQALLRNLQAIENLGVNLPPDLRSRIFDLVDTAVELDERLNTVRNNLVELSNGVRVNGEILNQAFTAGAEAVSRLNRELNVAETTAANTANELLALEREFRARVRVDVEAVGDVDFVSQLLSGIGAPSRLLEGQGPQTTDDLLVQLEAPTDALARGRGIIPTLEEDRLAREAARGRRRGGRGRQSNVARETEGIERQIRALEQQAQAFTLSTEEANRNRIEQELLNAAQRDGTTVTDQMSNNFSELAGRFAQAAQAVTELEQRQRQLNQATQFFGGLASNALSQLIVQGADAGEVFANLAVQIGQALVQAALFGGGPLGSLFGSTGGILGSLFSGLFGFEDGGIMTSRGPLPLRAYQSGGVASSPQLALFGEGSQNEAFVPLPDGRSIPVTMTAPANFNRPAPQQIQVTFRNDVDENGNIRTFTQGVAGEVVQSSAPTIVEAGAQRARAFTVGDVSRAQRQRGGDFRID